MHRNASQSKKIDVTTGSSLVDLKAELFRKKQEFASRTVRQTTSQQQTSDDYEQAKLTNRDMTNTKWHQKAKEIEERIRYKTRERRLHTKNAVEATANVEGEEEEEDELQRTLKLSRQKLEEKSKLYDQKKQKALDNIVNDVETDKADEQDLVNFDDKILFEHRQGLLKRPIQKDQQILDDLVDYEDSFGRVRQCKRSELEMMNKLNEELLHRRTITANLNELEQFGRSELKKQSEEMEKEEDEESPVATYQKVSRNEVREHGTSYIQFSTDLKERQKQMQSLEETRSQLMKQKQKSQTQKEKRLELVKQRLAKVARRKGLISKEEEEQEDLTSVQFINKYAGDTGVEDERSIQKKELIDLNEEIRYENIQSLKRKKDKLREWDLEKEDVRFVLATDSKKRKEESDDEKGEEDEIDKFLNDTFQSAARCE